MLNAFFSLAASRSFFNSIFFDVHLNPLLHLFMSKPITPQVATAYWIQNLCPLCCNGYKTVKHTLQTEPFSNSLAITRHIRTYHSIPDRELLQNKIPKSLHKYYDFVTPPPKRKPKLNPSAYRALIALGHPSIKSCDSL